jgi:bacillithiol biosynthesis cysteine-adding enzyme BshC
MESACVRHTEIPGTSKLFADYQYHFDRVQRFYDHWYGDPQSFERAASALDYPEERRAALVEALREQNAGNPLLDLLAKPGTVAIVTGQQVGLFSGPSYTIYKALTAARLAKELTSQGIPAVPIFWLATEDHDFAEVNHCFVFNSGYDPVRLQVDGANEGQRPVGGIAIEHAPVEALREALRGFPFGEETATLVAEAYAPGATMGEAFERLLRSLLDKWGVLFVDPMKPAVRRIAAPLLCEALKSANDLKQDLLKRNQELVDAGYHAQVHIEAQTSLFFLLDNGRRVSLRRQNGGYASKDRIYTIDELVDRAEQLSPNALLRPVVQDYLLPTIAYVGGPAELAYMAQSQVLYHRLLGRMPVMLARNGFTILEHRAAKLLERYGLRVAALFQPESVLREQIARKLIPGELVQEFEEVRQHLAQSLDKLQTHVTQFDPTLAAALERSRAKILFQLAKMEGKAEREALRRDERASADARYLVHLIYPEKHLQERFYSILPFVAKHGPELLDTIYEQVSLDCPDHKLLIV